MRKLYTSCSSLICWTCSVSFWFEYLLSHTIDVHILSSILRKNLGLATVLATLNNTMNGKRLTIRENETNHSQQKHIFIQCFDSNMLCFARFHDVSLILNFELLLFFEVHTKLLPENLMHRINIRRSIRKIEMMWKMKIVFFFDAG